MPGWDRSEETRSGWAARESSVAGSRRERGGPAMRSSLRAVPAEDVDRRAAGSSQRALVAIELPGSGRGGRDAVPPRRARARAPGGDRAWKEPLPSSSLPRDIVDPLVEVVPPVVSGASRIVRSAWHARAGSSERATTEFATSGAAAPKATEPRLTSRAARSSSGRAATSSAP